MTSGGDGLTDRASLTLSIAAESPTPWSARVVSEIRKWHVLTAKWPQCGSSTAADVKILHEHASCYPPEI